MSRETDVQTLIDEWNAEVREHGIWTSGHCIAAKMAVLLIREGPPQEPPRLRELATMMARRNHGSLGLYGHKTGSNKAAVDTCEHPDCVLVRQPAGLREGPPAPPGHAGDAPATEPVKPCADGHVWSNQFGDDWTPEVGTPCDCREKIWRGSGAVALAASQAGEAPQEAVPDHCENCRAELPVTTVHLCHAYLPSAPSEHAGWLRGMVSDIVLYVRKDARHTTEVEQTLRYLVKRWPFHAFAVSQAGTAQRADVAPMDFLEAELRGPGYSVIRSWLALHGGASERIVREEISQMLRRYLAAHVAVPPK